MNLPIARALRTVAREKSDTSLLMLVITLGRNGWQHRPQFGLYYHYTSPCGRIVLEVRESTLHANMRVYFDGVEYGKVCCGYVRDGRGMVMHTEYKTTNIIYKESVS